MFPDLRVFSLCGNHDMYSGGAPYYALLDRLGQPSSYVCLRNAHWQLLGMDTGYNDYDPFREERAMTWLRDGTGADGREVDEVSEVNCGHPGLQHAPAGAGAALARRRDPVAVGAEALPTGVRALRRA